MTDRVLILGGNGFIGRHLLQYIVENNLASFVRVVDKVLPQTAYFTERQHAAFNKEVVQFKQGNLTSESSVQACFAHDGGPFDYVFNCAGETKYGQTDEVYKERVLGLTTICAKQAAATGVKRFVEISTAQVYNGDKKASTEDSKLEPWTGLGAAKLKAEEELKNIPNLKYVVVRPAIVYGISDVLGLTPRLIMGAVYKQLQEKMKLLWTESLRLNTVHVDDVVRALWHLRNAGPDKEVYNLADKSDSTQDSISTFVDGIFGISHSYHGTIVSNLARTMMKTATEEANEKHMDAWAEIIKKDNIVNTPLSPYLDQELLYNNHTFVDGTKIEKTGFAYTRPQVTLESLKEVVQEYIKLGLFPASVFA